MANTPSADGTGSYQDILVEEPRPYVLLITLNRPDARNALHTPMLAEIAACLRAAADKDAIRAVVITGGEKVFAAGADLKELGDHDAVSIENDPRPGHWALIQAFPKPLIAAVNGYALGGGNELALSADIIIAGDDAKFGQPEVNVGIMPGAGGTQRLTHAVGKSLAMQMVMAADFIDADRAQAAGLVSEVVAPEECIARAVRLAETIAAKAPKAVQLAKQAVLKADEEALKGGLQFERRAFCSLFATEDKTEGIQAFLEKRKPDFKGK
ncbi:MAG: enoyl-CoA hydratase/isomerase family protein [Rhodospirillales bacterium]|nr:enoyl-CoA hydratase/isomerase family protein [Rhodospirillales bacterium]